MDMNYEFADLADNDELLQEIRVLEEKIENSISKKVNLIAYSESNHSSDKTNEG
jgi:hypothetical protein